MWLLCLRVFLLQECVARCVDVSAGAQGSRGVSVPGLECRGLPCGCWESNPGSLDEQAVLLTSATSPALAVISVVENPVDVAESNF